MAPNDRYLVELQRPHAGWQELQAATARARVAAEQLSAEGTPVRFLRSIFVPEDESCFFLFQGEDPGCVRQVISRADLVLRGFVQTVLDPEP